MMGCNFLYLPLKPASGITLFTWQWYKGRLVWASYQIRKIAGCACAGNAGNVFPRRRFQRKPLVSDPGMHHGTCVTHVPWCMSGSLTCGDGENVPGIPGACEPAILRIWKEAHGVTRGRYWIPAKDNNKTITACAFLMIYLWHFLNSRFIIQFLFFLIAPHRHMIWFVIFSYLIIDYYFRRFWYFID